MTKNKILFSEKNRDSISLAITCGFYVILFVLFAVIPVSKPKKYTQISVQLDVPVAKKTENTQQLPQKIEEQKTETKTVEKPVEKQNTVNQQKTQTATTKTSQSSVQKQSTSTSSTKSSNSSTQKAQATTQQTQQKQQTASVQEKTEPMQTVTKREVVYQKSIEELMAENAKKKKETSTWDDSIFGDDSSSVVQSQNNVAQNLGNSQNNATQTFEGVAASSSTSETVKTSSESRFSGTSQNQVSSSTSDALNKISSTTYVSKNGSESISYETSGVLAPRQLLYPSEPSIVISESLEDKIARTKTVKISFVVKSDGSVDTKTIKIEPVGILVPEIEAEIKGQISLWRFESGKSDGQATFNYSINVR